MPHNIHSGSRGKVDHTGRWIEVGEEGGGGGGRLQKLRREKVLGFLGMGGRGWIGGQVLLIDPLKDERERSGCSLAF